SLSLETYPSVGNGFSARLIDRLVAHYRKPVVLSAANHGPATSTVLSAGNASSALSVGAYISKRSLLVNLGWRVNREDNVALFSGRGPANDGAMKPDILAPYQSVSASPCEYQSPTRPFVYRLPSCYQLGGGTSNATPFAAGALARLLSAARLTGLHAD